MTCLPQSPGQHPGVLSPGCVLFCPDAVTAGGQQPKAPSLSRAVLSCCALGAAAGREEPRGRGAWPSERVSRWHERDLTMSIHCLPRASPALTQSLGKGIELAPGLRGQAVSAKGIMFSHERVSEGQGQHLNGTLKCLPGTEGWEAQG